MCGDRRQTVAQRLNRSSFFFVQLVENPKHAMAGDPLQVGKVAEAAVAGEKRPPAGGGQRKGERIGERESYLLLPVRGPVTGLLRNAPT